MSTRPCPLTKNQFIFLIFFIYSSSEEGEDDNARKVISAISLTSFFASQAKSVLSPTKPSESSDSSTTLVPPSRVSTTTPFLQRQSTVSKPLPVSKYSVLNTRHQSNNDDINILDSGKSSESDEDLGPRTSRKKSSRKRSLSRASHSRQTIRLYAVKWYGRSDKSVY